MAGERETTRKVAFFGHDAADSAVRRRVQSFRDDQVAVTGFMMRRGEPEELEWENVDLGLTISEAYLNRVKAVITGARIAASARDELASADLIYARNLDMLACAFLAMRLSGVRRPVVYECLDIHRLLVNGSIGRVMRRVERMLLKRCCLLVVSSPAFLKHHFEVHHRGCYQAFLLENRMAAGANHGQRLTTSVSRRGDPLRLGWFGVLRCQRSFELILGLADRFGDRLAVELHGQPAHVEISDFDEEVAKRENVCFGGRYRAPEDLARLYDGVDVVWAGDFMDAGFNSVWLLPNRLYEGGFYSTPAIAPAGTETASWIESRRCGFSVGEPLQESLATLVEALLEDRGPIVAAQRALADLEEEVFVQPRGQMAALIQVALDAGPLSVLKR